jgi:hypothetical protein
MMKAVAKPGGVLKVAEGDMLLYQWYFSPRPILTAR